MKTKKCSLFSKKYSFAFYISGKSTRLKKFLQQNNNNYIKNVKIVVSDRCVESELKDLIKGLGINLLEVDYNSMNIGSDKGKNEVFSNKLLVALKTNSIDYCFSFGSHLLVGKILEDFEFRIINFHPAILPMFPGINAIDQAVEHGNVLLVGNTAHFIDKGIDTGPVIMQSVIPIQNFLKNKDYGVILDLQITMLNKLFNIICNGDLVASREGVFIRNADYKQFHIYPSY